MKTRDRRRSRRSCTSGWRSSSGRASCWRPSACGCARPTTSRCCARSASARGIENYSRHIDGRERRRGARTRCSTTSPTTGSCVIDESHVTVPQLHGMYEGDRSPQGHARRVRVPAAQRPGQPAAAVRGVRPEACEQVVFMSATPAPYELRVSGERVVEQIVRPTGLIDPEVEVRPDEGPDRRPDRARSASAPRPSSACWSPRSRRRWPRTSPTTCSRWGSASATCTPRSTRSSGSRSSATCGWGSSTCSSASTCCAKGLDLPEVSLVAILDADKEGFLRSETSLIQTIGRAARNVDGTGDHVRRPRSPTR